MKTKQPKEVLKIGTVTEGKSKLKFKLVLEGEWDWNRDIAGPINESLLGGYGAKHEHTLKAALQRGLANRIFDRCEDMFESVRLIESSLNAEMEQAWKASLAAQDAETKQEKEKALAEVEAQAARLRKELGR